MEERTEMFVQESAILKDVQRSRIRALAKLFYDLQKERIAIGNRIVSYFRLAAGLSPQEPDKPDLDPEEDALLQKVLLEYYAILDSYTALSETSKTTPRISTVIKNFANKSYILSETEYVLCQLYADLVNSEERLRSRVEKLNKLFFVSLSFLFRKSDKHSSACFGKGCSPKKDAGTDNFPTFL